MAHHITLEQKEGTYTIVYGEHVRSQNPSDIPETTQAIILETGAIPYLADPLKALSDAKKHLQYKALFAYAEKKKIPIIFADLKYRINDQLLLLMDTSVPAVEWMMGLNILKQKRSRTGRELRTVTAFWLMMPFLTNILHMSSAMLGRGQRITANLKRLSHKLHPEAELLILTLRNAIFAEKAKYLLSDLQKPHITTVIGSGHVGIEDMFQMDDKKRLSLLSGFQKILKHLAMPEYGYKAVRYDYKDNEWVIGKTYEVPSLKGLVP
jgi:hypothetical protein